MLRIFLLIFIEKIIGEYNIFKRYKKLKVSLNTFQIVLYIENYKLSIVKFIKYFKLLGFNFSRINVSIVYFLTLPLKYQVDV